MPQHMPVLHVEIDCGSVTIGMETRSGVRFFSALTAVKMDILLQ